MYACIMCLCMYACMCLCMYVCMYASSKIGGSCEVASHLVEHGSKPGRSACNGQ